MAWLRLDDRFTKHPKFDGWTPSEKWAWLEVLEYCAAYKTGGAIPSDVSIMPRSTTPALLRKAVESGLADALPDGSLCVHDWSEYNPRDPRAAERMAAVRARAPQPRGGRWEKTRAAVYERDRGVCADCGDTDDEAFAKGSRSGWNADHEPSREVLVARGDSIYDPAFIVTRCHSCHSKKTRREGANTSEHTTELSTEHQPNTQGANTTEHAFTRARARVPVPSPTPLRNNPAAQEANLDADSADGPVPAAADRLSSAGWTDEQIRQASGRPGGWPRALAWLEHSEADPSCREPGALAWTKFLGGGEPPERQATLAPGAQGTRSTTSGEHKCPHCGVVKAGPASLAEHIENVHWELAA